MNSNKKNQNKPIDYYLDDCIEKHKRNPFSFEIPSEEDIEDIRVGDSAKLIFVPLDFDRLNDRQKIRGERMWVTIIEAADGKFTGELDNDPVIINNLKFKDIVRFESKHIAGILKSEPNRIKRSSRN